MMKYFRVDEKAGYVREGIEYKVLHVKGDREELFPRGDFSYFKELSDYISQNRRFGVCLDLRGRSYSYDFSTLSKLMELSNTLKISNRKGLGLKRVPELDCRIFTDNFPEGHFHIYEEGEGVVGVEEVIEG